MDLRNKIIFVTLLLVLYNMLFAYVVVNLTSGTGRIVFLALLLMDYFVIFYFIIQVAHEAKFQKATASKKNVKRVGMK